MPPWQKGFPNLGAQDQDDRQQGFQAMGGIPQDKDERQMPGPPVPMPGIGTLIMNYFHYQVKKINPYTKFISQIKKNRIRIVSVSVCFIPQKSHSHNTPPLATIFEKMMQRTNGLN